MFYLFCSIHLQFQILGGVCPTKKFCPAGTGIPLDCAPGSYMNHTQASKCYNCPAGFHCVDADIQECLQGNTKFEQVFRVALENVYLRFWEKNPISLSTIYPDLLSVCLIKVSRLFFIKLLGIFPKLTGTNIFTKTYWGLLWFNSCIN